MYTTHTRAGPSGRDHAALRHGTRTRSIGKGRHRSEDEKVRHLEGRTGRLHLGRVEVSRERGLGTAFVLCPLDVTPGSQLADTLGIWDGTGQTGFVSTGIDSGV